MFDISMFKSTLKEDASASFFRLGRTLAWGHRIANHPPQTHFSLDFFNHVHCLCIVQPSV